MEADAALLAQAGSLSAGVLAEAAAGGGALRAFTFSVDLRRFVAGPRLPLNLASVALELDLPTELAGLIQASNGRLPPRLAPLRTQAVAVARGSEAALPGGRASVDFAAGLMAVATLLARSPVLTVDVYHRQRLADDLLLGRAHVPLAPLLQESWVEGRAGVYALAPSAAHPARHERTQIGTLHLVMSLEEAGPAGAGPAAAAASPAAADATARAAATLPAALPAALPEAAAELRPAAGRGEPADSDGLSAAPAPEVQHEEQQQASTQPPAAPAAGLSAAGPPPPAAALAACFPAAAPAPAAVGGIGGPEFEAAWELELWKREEEARWRGELQEREANRMAALEEAWRRREAEREGEAATLRSEYAALEARARQVLAAAEERETRVVAAEEGVARRRRELEREHATRVAEAEAAVRRLQAECQHQLELEAQRRQAATQAAVAAEARAAAAEARVAVAEKAVAAHREAHARSDAGRLESELAAMQRQVAEAEARAAKAAEAKRKYKEQVVRLAGEVASLQTQLAELAGMKRRQLDAELAELQAREQALAARRDVAEMGDLKRQLAALQMGGGSGNAAAGVAARGRGSPGGKENGEAADAACAAGAAAATRPTVLPAGELSEAVARLAAERELLLSSGAYAPGDPLIDQLDARLRECAALAAASVP